MNDVKISPSMMCADFTILKDQVSELEKAKVELLHMDIMDGVFVPNITLSNDICKNIRKLTNVPFDYHFMITEPEKKLSWFDIKEGDYVSFHYEACDDKAIKEAIAYIKSKKAKCGIAINPNNEFEVLLPYLKSIDFVLVMGVYPGFAGQKLIPETLGKMKKLYDYINSNGLNLEIEIDGNVSYPNSIEMRKCGANIFVGGTSSIFRSDSTIVDGVNKLRESIRLGE